MMHNMGLPSLLMIVVYMAIVVVPFYQIWKRTGHNGWIALLMLVPLVNVVMLYVIAFKQWPIEQKS
ncbi:uncharacterized protein (DUF983 family) [Loktanella ponticola]|uniref:Uncharacterized protein (DUF983 family) n=1 Tax=Yoonia ponticola TaxID=1524255 RepID=A0A7W9EXZ9_9RHOB|nr:hypothetical protein [Yoonia ponticola]MBB5722169.1 uncharacterized protein (DUF983 family) [Yoonia ponticola]